MTLRIPGAAKALFVLTATGLLLSGCHTYRPYYGGSHFSPHGHGYKHHYEGKSGKHGHRHRHHRHGHRGYR